MSLFMKDKIVGNARITKKVVDWNAVAGAAILGLLLLALIGG